MRALALKMYGFTELLRKSTNLVASFKASWDDEQITVLEVGKGNEM